MPAIPGAPRARARAASRADSGAFSWSISTQINLASNELVAMEALLRE